MTAAALPPQLAGIRIELEAASAAAEELCSGLDGLAGIDLARATYVSPIASYIRMNLFAFLRVHSAHERRHLWQATNVRRALPNRPDNAPKP